MAHGGGIVVDCSIYDWSGECWSNGEWPKTTCRHALTLHTIVQLRATHRGVEN